MIEKERSQDNNVQKLNTDPQLVKQALDKAARDAVERHRSMGHKIPYWENNQVVWRLPTSHESDVG